MSQVKRAQAKTTPDADASDIVRAPHDGPRSSGFPHWSKAEDAVLVEAYPNYPEMVRRVPDRTRKAIEYRCDHLGLSKRKHVWKSPEVKRLIEMGDAGFTIREMVAAFPNFTENQVRIKALRLGIAYMRTRPGLVGVPVLDLIRNRAWQHRISLTLLDRRAGSGQYFASGSPKLRWRHIAVALRLLGGTLVTPSWEND